MDENSSKKDLLELIKKLQKRKLKIKLAVIGIGVTLFICIVTVLFGWIEAILGWLFTDEYDKDNVTLSEIVEDIRKNDYEWSEDTCAGDLGDVYKYMISPEVLCELIQEYDQKAKHYRLRNFKLGTCAAYVGQFPSGETIKGAPASWKLRYYEEITANYMKFDEGVELEQFSFGWEHCYCLYLMSQYAEIEHNPFAILEMQNVGEDVEDTLGDVESAEDYDEMLDSMEEGGGSKNARKKYLKELKKYRKSDEWQETVNEKERFVRTLVDDFVIDVEASLFKGDDTIDVEYVYDIYANHEDKSTLSWSTLYTIPHTNVSDISLSKVAYNSNQKEAIYVGRKFRLPYALIKKIDFYLGSYEYLYREVKGSQGESLKMVSSIIKTIDMGAFEEKCESLCKGGIGYDTTLYLQFLTSVCGEEDPICEMLMTYEGYHEQQKITSTTGFGNIVWGSEGTDAEAIPDYTEGNEVMEKPTGSAKGSPKDYVFGATWVDISSTVSGLVPSYQPSSYRFADKTTWLYSDSGIGQASGGTSGISSGTNVSNINMSGADEVKKTGTLGIIKSTDDANKLYGMSIPLFRQADSRWANKKYGDSTIVSSGCGPTSIAMVMTYLRQENITPPDVCKWSEDSGCYISGAGTSWNIFEMCEQKYSDEKVKITVEQGTMNYMVRTKQTIMNALAAGKPIIVSTGSGGNGIFTSGGHFIVLRGCDTSKRYVYVNDPNDSFSYTTSANKYNEKPYMNDAFLYEVFINEMKWANGGFKNYWIFTAEYLE